MKIRETGARIGLAVAIAVAAALLGRWVGVAAGSDAGPIAVAAAILAALPALTARDAESGVRRLAVTVLAALSLLLVVTAALSLRWRMEHDTPIMLYCAFLADHFHKLPYRDFVDLNPPGNYPVNLLIGRLFGYTDLGVRLADLLVLAALAGVTWLVMRRFGRLAGWAAAVTFPALYLARGPMISLEREYLLLLPISGAVWLALPGGRLTPTLRALAAGLLFGACATIKPHVIIALPAVLVLIWVEARGGRGSDLPEASAEAAGASPARPSQPTPGESAVGVHERASVRAPLALAPSERPEPADGPAGRAPSDLATALRLVAAASAGAAVPVLGAAAWLYGTGALPAFIDTARNLWPLYGALTGEHRTMGDIARVPYLLRGFLEMGGLRWWLVGAAAGAYALFARTRRDASVRRPAILLFALLGSYALYPVPAGKFWYYHWIPFHYFATLAASLALAEDGKGLRGGVWAPLIALVLITGSVSLPGSLPQMKQGWPGPQPRTERADAIAAYLRAHLRPGDTVQPLDWTGGAVYAMLLARADLATPFVSDCQFYLPLTSPYVRRIRGEFMDSLTAAPPRFIVEVTKEKGQVWGPGTPQEFRELRRILESRYARAAAGDGYAIYERRTPGSGRDARGDHPQ